MNYTNIMLEHFSSVWSQTGLVSDKNHCNIVGPFSGLEFETVSAVPRGPAAGRDGKPRGFETITQLLQLNFIIVAIGNWGTGRVPFIALLLPCAGGMLSRVLCPASGWDGYQKQPFLWAEVSGFCHALRLCDHWRGELLRHSQINLQGELASLKRNGFPKLSVAVFLCGRRDSAIISSLMTV